MPHSEQSAGGWASVFLAAAGVAIGAATVIVFSKSVDRNGNHKEPEPSAAATPSGTPSSNQERKQEGEGSPVSPPTRISRFDATKDAIGSGGCRPLMGLFPSETYQPLLSAPDVFRRICATALNYPAQVLELQMDVVGYHVTNLSAALSPLTRDERYAIAWYTSDVRDLGLKVESNWWFVVNRLLRERNMKELEAHRDGIYYLQAALQKLWLPEPSQGESNEVVVWRGLKGVRLTEVSQTYRQGATICWPAFSSVSLNQSTMQAFSGGQGGTLIQVKCPRSSIADISSLSLIPSEAECLLGINTMLEVEHAVPIEALGAFLGGNNLPPGVDLVIVKVVDTPPFGQFLVKGGSSGNAPTGPTPLQPPPYPPHLLQHIAAIRLQPTSADAWLILANAMSATDTVMLNGAPFSKRHCYVEALRCQPKNSFAWNGLGTGMNATDQVTVNGVSYDRRQCYLQALQHNPNLSSVWHNLGVGMNATDQVLLNGTSYDRRQCYVQALKHNPKFSAAWDSLGVGMSATDQVTVNGVSYDRRQCYLQALQHNLRNSFAWNHLGIGMNAVDRVTVNGKSYDRRQCFLEALQHDPRNGKAWASLAAGMSSTEQVTVNGQSFTKADCVAQSNTN